MSGQIFISYRRDDTPAWARLLYDRLLQQFSQNEIFMDVDMDLGVDFVKAIEESVGSCDVLIAVIGRRWLTSSHEEGRRRLDNSEDFVRIEIGTALKRGVRVIPVLVDGVSMPRSGDLPDDLKSLLRRQALEVSHSRFNADSERLIGAVERALEKAKTEQRQREEKERLEEKCRNREQKERFDALLRESEEKEPHLTESARELPPEHAIPVPPREEKALLWQTPKVRILAASAGVAIAMVALVLVLSQWLTKPRSVPANTEPPATIAYTPAPVTPAQVVPVTAPTSLPGTVSGATKEHPFVNSLGMKFVPVPGTNVLFSVWETRAKDYQAFCDAKGISWEKPTFSQTDEHSAVNVSWDDAKAFCGWLSEKEDKRYRLPTDHEWSCAIGIGDQENADATPKSKDMKIAGVFPWGKQWPPPDDAGNYFGEECKAPRGLAELKAAGYDVSSWPVINGFNDGKVLTATAGGFRPNGLGICDLGGNVWEWCQDAYEPGSASRVLRGGSWSGNNSDGVLSSERVTGVPGGRHGDVGFRAVVETGSGR